MKRLSSIGCVLAAWMFWAAPASGSIRAYHIGNSLTGQSMVHAGATLEDLTFASGTSDTWAWHIKSGSSLTAMVAQPEITSLPTTAPYGTYSGALSAFQWDVVTLQPYGAPIVGERAAFSQIVTLARTNPANAGTTFYLFSAWPQGLSADTYAVRWNRSYNRLVDDPESRWSRAYSTALLEDVRADNGGASIFMIPSGEVLYRLDQMARAGMLTSFDSADSFLSPLDPYHLNTTGSYISRLTWFATMFRQSPVGLPVPANVDLTSTDLALVQQTVWDVVNADTGLTGVPEPGVMMMLTACMALGLQRRSRRIPAPVN